MLASMAIFGVMTMVASFTHSVSALTLFRALAGFGLGGAIPNGAALAAEYVPVRQRPFAVTLTIVCVPLGAMFAGIVAERFLPTLGWRGLFGIGGAVPVVMAAAFFLLLPESPRFLARRERRWSELDRTLHRMGHVIPPGATFVDTVETATSVQAGARIERGSLKALLSRSFRADTLALWGAFFCSLLAVYLVFSWLPSMLTGAGLGRSANTGITAFNLGGVAGALVGGRSIARFGSRTPILIVAVGSAAAALVMSGMAITASAGATPIIAMLAVTGGLINATQTMMYALAASVYPTMLRATGVGAASAVGRAGAIVSGYAGPWAIAFHGSASFFQLIAVAMLVSSACLAVIARHVKGTAAAR
jgi:AAHS family 4-hydroxybenzoate transporter-like MFS transporter